MALTHTPAQILHTWLAAQAGRPTGLGLYYHHMPSEPVLCLAMATSEGVVYGRGHATGKQYQGHGVQLRARGATEAAALGAINWARNLLEALVAPVVVTVGASTYTLHPCHQYGTLASLGTPDKLKHPEYTQDYRTTIHQQ